MTVRLCKGCKNAQANPCGACRTGKGRCTCLPSYKCTCGDAELAQRRKKNTGRGRLFCLHSYSKWSKLSGGKKRRNCKKCNKKQVKNASAWDQFWCSHRYRKDRRRKQITLTCKKCAKQKEGKTR